MERCAHPLFEVVMSCERDPTTREFSAIAKLLCASCGHQLPKGKKLPRGSWVKGMEVRTINNGGRV